MSKLETVINRIKATHAPLAPPADAPTPADDLRAVFAAFPDELQRAMRQAGQAERWTPAQWRDEVGIVEGIRVQAGYADDANRAVEKIYLAVTARPPVTPSKERNDHG